MKRYLLLGLCVLVSFVGFAQSDRVVRGVVMDVNDTPLVDATIKAVSSSETMKAGPGGMFTMTVSPSLRLLSFLSTTTTVGSPSWLATARLLWSSILKRALNISLTL